MRVVSADWVVPVEGPPIADGAVAIADDGTIAAVGAAADLGRGEHHEGCVIVPGFVNAHSHIEYAVYAGFGDGLPFVPWIGMHIQRKEALDFDDMVAIATVGRPRVPALGDHDDRRLQLLGRGRDRCRGDRAARDRLPRGLRSATRRRSTGSTSRARGSSTVLSDRVRLGVSPHAPYTCTIEVYRACAELGLPQATHFAESAAERDWLVDGAGDWSPLAEFLVPPPGETGIRMLAAEGLLGPGLMAAHCVHADPEEIELLARRRRRRRPLPPLERLPRLRRRPARGASRRGRRRVDRDRQPGIDAVARPVRGDPDARSSAPVPAPGGPMRCLRRDALELATLGGARVLGMDDRIGSLVPGKQADLAVISLVDSPFDPVEDPVTAAVLGGSPDRVAATLVAGEQRYLKGTSRWPDSTRAARSARSKMLP